MPDSIELTTLIDRIKWHIDRITLADDRPAWAKGTQWVTQDCAVITGLALGGQIACIRCGRLDLVDELDEYASRAREWLRQRDKVRRYLAA